MKIFSTILVLVERSVNSLIRGLFFCIRHKIDLPIGSLKPLSRLLINRKRVSKSLKSKHRLLIQGL